MTFFGPIFFLLPELIFGAVFLVILLVVVFYTGHREPDPRGRRPYAAYLFSLTFVGVVAALAAAGFASQTVAGSLAETNSARCYVSEETSSETGAPPPERAPLPRFTYSPAPFPTFSYRTVEPIPEPSFESLAPASLKISPQSVDCTGGDPGRRARGIKAGIYLIAAGGLALYAGRAARTLIAKEEADV